MGFIGEYREGVRNMLDASPSAAPFEKIKLGAIGILGVYVRRSDEAMLRNTPRIVPVEAVWYTPLDDMTAEELEAQIKEYRESTTGS